MDKPIKIIFSKKASSKNLPEALRLANKLGGISEGDIIRIKLSTQEVFNLWEWINALLNIIDKWASFEIYYKGILCKVNKEYRRLFYALQDLRQCYHANQDNPVDFEKCNPAWGCDQIQTVSLNLNAKSKQWYQYGNLTAPGVWLIDKAKILNAVQVEIARKHLTACPAFPASRVQKVIDKLPNSIVLDEFWEIEYKNEMIGGVLTKIVNSISYNAEFEKDWFSMEKLLSEINKSSANPYTQGSDEWLDWMLNKGYLKK